MTGGGPMPPEAEAVAALAASPLFRARWYAGRHPDVAASGLDPALHYLRYGAAMGRSPSRAFDGAAYLAANPDVAAQGWNPLLHYLCHGAAEGRAAAPLADPARDGTARLVALRAQLHGQGLTDAGLAGLAAMAETDPDPGLRARAALETALWHLRARDADGAGAALAAVALARRQPPPRFRARPERATALALAVAEQLALQFLDRAGEGHAAFARAAAAGLAEADLILASVWALPDAATRLARINTVLAAGGLAPLALQPGSAAPYDRLTPARPPAPTGQGGPLVSVLVAAHQAEATIGTALRSLSAQSWQQLEILVIDDASTDATAARVAEAAAADPRIRLIALPVNGGAYVARNIGLAQAQGSFVTLHDADDWAHPARIETQMQALLAGPGTLANTSRQARMQDDLRLARMTGQGALVITNTASLLFRRAPVQERLGCWDGVRFGADNELIRRMTRVFGEDAVAHLPTAPLAFQRERADSMLADPVRGMQGFYFGARKDYAEAQAHHHASGAVLNYAPGPAPRPFPVVPMMLPAPPPGPAHLAVVVAGDLREDSLPAALAAHDHLATGGTGLLGLVELYDPARPAPAALAPALRAAVAQGRARVLVHGETASCDRLLLPDPAPLAHAHRYLPDLTPGSIEGPGPWPPGTGAAS